MVRRTGLVADYEKWLREGRGTGDGRDYRPWLMTLDCSSMAVKTRVYSARFERFMHFLSHGEFLAFLQYEWNDKTISIKEQYPLDPRITERLAEDMGIRHPSIRGQAVVMTSDLLVTLQRPEAKTETIAIQIKHSERDLDERTKEKLVLEKEYWTVRGKRFALVLSSEFNDIFCKNLELLYPYRNRVISDTEIEESLYELCKAKRNGREAGALGQKEMGALKMLIARRIVDYPVKEKSVYEACWEDIRGIENAL